MKTLFLTVALAMGTTALAQTTAPAEPMQEPMPAQPMDQPMMSTGPKQVMPSRSINEAFPPPAPPASYPVCTRTVTDGCVQRPGSPRPPGSPRGATS